MTIELYINYYGTTAWHTHGYRHRLNGPAAVEYPWGHKEWWVNGKLHRLDGPAIEYSNGHKEWYVNGVTYDTYLEYLVAVD